MFLNLEQQNIGIYSKISQDIFPFTIVASGGFRLKNTWFYSTIERVIPGDQGCKVILEKLIWIWERVWEMVWDRVRKGLGEGVGRGVGEGLEEGLGESLGETLGEGLGEDMKRKRRPRVHGSES